MEYLYNLSAKAWRIAFSVIQLLASFGIVWITDERFPLFTTQTEHLIGFPLLTIPILIFSKLGGSLVLAAFGVVLDHSNYLNPQMWRND